MSVFGQSGRTSHTPKPVDKNSLYTQRAQLYSQGSFFSAYLQKVCASRRVRRFPKNKLYYIIYFSEAAAHDAAVPYTYNVRGYMRTLSANRRKKRTLGV